MTDEMDQAAEYPPVEQDELIEPPPTKWPKVIGVISLIYAIIGLLGQVCAIAGTFLSRWLMSLGGMDVQMPAALKYQAVVTAAVMVPVGLLLLFGAINLLRRRRGGVTMLKRWAVIRLVLVVVGLVVGYVMLPASLELQRSIQEEANKAAREGGRSDLVQEFDEDATWRTSIVTAGVFAGVFAIYPVFLGFYLSAPKIDEETSQW